MNDKKKQPSLSARSQPGLQELAARLGVNVIKVDAHAFSQQIADAVNSGSLGFIAKGDGKSALSPSPQLAGLMPRKSAAEVERIFGTPLTSRETLVQYSKGIDWLLAQLETDDWNEMNESIAKWKLGPRLRNLRWEQCGHANLQRAADRSVSNVCYIPDASMDVLACYLIDVAINDCPEMDREHNVLMVKPGKATTECAGVVLASHVLALEELRQSMGRIVIPESLDINVNATAILWRHAFLDQLIRCKSGVESKQVTVELCDEFDIDSTAHLLKLIKKDPRLIKAMGIKYTNRAFSEPAQTNIELFERLRMAIGSIIADLDNLDATDQQQYSYDNSVRSQQEELCADFKTAVFCKPKIRAQKKKTSPLEPAPEPVRVKPTTMTMEIREVESGMPQELDFTNLQSDVIGAARLIGTKVENASKLDTVFSELIKFTQQNAVEAVSLLHEDLQRGLRYVAEQWRVILSSSKAMKLTTGETNAIWLMLSTLSQWLSAQYDKHQSTLNGHANSYSGADITMHLQRTVAMWLLQNGNKQNRHPHALKAIQEKMAGLSDYRLQVSIGAMPPGVQQDILRLAIDNPFFQQDHTDIMAETGRTKRLAAALSVATDSDKTTSALPFAYSVRGKWGKRFVVSPPETTTVNNLQAQVVRAYFPEREKPEAEAADEFAYTICPGTDGMSGVWPLPTSPKESTGSHVGIARRDIPDHVEVLNTRANSLFMENCEEFVDSLDENEVDTVLRTLLIVEGDDDVIYIVCPHFEIASRIMQTQNSIVENKEYKICSHMHNEAFAQQYHLPEISQTHAIVEIRKKEVTGEVQVEKPHHFGTSHGGNGATENDGTNVAVDVAKKKKTESDRTSREVDADERVKFMWRYMNRYFPEFKLITEGNDDIKPGLRREDITDGSELEGLSFLMRLPERDFQVFGSASGSMFIVNGIRDAKDFKNVNNLVLRQMRAEVIAWTGDQKVWEAKQKLRLRALKDEKRNVLPVGPNHYAAVLDTEGFSERVIETLTNDMRGLLTMLGTDGEKATGLDAIGRRHYDRIQTDTVYSFDMHGISTGATNLARWRRWMLPTIQTGTNDILNAAVRIVCQEEKPEHLTETQVVNILHEVRRAAAGTASEN